MTPNTSYREILLTQGQIAIVDAEDYEWLNKYKWCSALDKGTGRYYAIRRGDFGKTLRMHREILGLLHGDRRKGDHRDNNQTLDNRKANLRVANPKGNACNRGKQRNNTSGFKGVSFRKDCSKWVASIRNNQKLIHLGYFPTKEAAHMAYCKAASRYHGEFARSE